jgi:hypothetical protein
MKIGIKTAIAARTIIAKTAKTRAAMVMWDIATIIIEACVAITAGKQATKRAMEI